MKIYTKTGDQGKTSLVYGQRVSKHDARVEVYGTCDEANSAIGLALSFLPPGEEWVEIRRSLEKIQTQLFHVGAELATPPGKKVGWPIKEEDVAFLERQIDSWDEQLPELRQFILPGGHSAAASLHLERTIVRRAERRLVEAMERESISSLVLIYLNRLSDFLFVAARYVNWRSGIHEPLLHAEQDK
ncbi:cob(I)yrinic acid a,c-diamide adenosyltransferase [Brevibacillus fulvus]|uniref:Corrinoid adenosyltransferase n=1 Tax=Brevibacillus fulvus TaxID=1125967 RepID=A0A938XXS4_9BACL|nr:cob(I)alamin adenosyltransferase [Brevibacillus fulvus]